MFKWIKADKRGKRKKVTLSFVPRDPQQTKYIDACYNHAKAELKKVGYAKSYAKAVGAFGKSIVDPVLMAKFQQDFWKVEHTNSPVPVSIHAFHSRVTLAENGKRAVQFRRAMGLNEEVIVISGCEVADEEGEYANVNRYPRYMNPRNATKAIKAAMLEGRPVLILTLYHHGETLSRIQKSLRRSYPGFKFWGKCKDETDWPCSNYNSSFAPMLDNRVEAVHTHGSTGTERIGDPHKDYGTNNLTIHGPCVFDYDWAQAEKDGLVKDFNLILQQFSQSDLKRIYPNLVKVDGTVNYKRRVNVGGRPVAGKHPTVMQVIKMASLALTLKKYPQIQRILGFSSFIKDNMLVQENFTHVAKAVLGKSKKERDIANLHIEEKNYKQYKGGALRSYEEQIKRAKSKGRYLLLSCRLFNRGYDDSAPVGYKGKWLKHHAAIHFSAKSDVNMCQEIWRVTRLDSSRDKYAYYILPLIYNDTDANQMNWEQDSYDLLTAIFKQHKKIQDEIIYAVDNGSETAREAAKQRFPIIDQLDPSLLGKLVHSISVNSRGKLLPHPYKEAHDWVIAELMKLEKPWRTHDKGKVYARFRKRYDYLFQVNGRTQCAENIRNWITNVIPTTSDLWNHKDKNLDAFEEYCEKQKKYFDDTLVRIVTDIQKKAKRSISTATKHWGQLEIIKKHTGLKDKQVGFFRDNHLNKVLGKGQKEKLSTYVAKNNLPKIADALIEAHEGCITFEEWADKAALALSKDFDVDTNILIGYVRVRGSAKQKTHAERFKHIGTRKYKKLLSLSDEMRATIKKTCRQ
jgi:hypothetical protein